MYRLAHKSQNTLRRKLRVRATVSGTKERPRLSVFISNQHISAQIINDDAQTTLVAATTVGSKITGSMSDKAAWTGTEIAKKAKQDKIKKVVLDRNGKLYHGRLKILADNARKEGLEF